jgi:hypothetical protein
MAFDNKVLGFGTLVKVDHDLNTVFTTVGNLKEVTPPPRERNTADGTALEDTIEQLDPGTHKANEFTFMQIWKVKNTNHEIIDTLYNSGAKVPWQVVYPQDTPVTDQFTGWVKKIAPTVKGPNEYWTREITVQQTTVITRT